MKPEVEKFVVWEQSLHDGMIQESPQDPGLNEIGKPVHLRGETLVN